MLENISCHVQLSNNFSKSLCMKNCLNTEFDLSAQMLLVYITRPITTKESHPHKMQWLPNPQEKKKTQRLLFDFQNKLPIAIYIHNNVQHIFYSWTGNYLFSRLIHKATLHEVRTDDINNRFFKGQPRLLAKDWMATQPKVRVPVIPFTLKSALNQNSRRILNFIV